MDDRELYSKWTKYYQIANKNMVHSKQNGKGILIEVAAQHPLLDGKYPNEEFTNRLDKAIGLYHELRKETSQIFIYVPGSIHSYKGKSDKLSLSQAGTNYLIKREIPLENIFGDSENRKYKGEEGVYNSSDECYVASQLFREREFKNIYCVCSPAQLMRKAFSYIRFGLIPLFEVASTENLYHNYIDEFFKMIPMLISENNALQGDSNLARKIRDKRKPK